MRKGITTFLILLLFLGPLAEVLPVSQDALLPACCRRNGTHHCAMSMASAMQMTASGANAGPSFNAPLACPFFPRVAAALLPTIHAILAEAAPPPRLRARRLRVIAPRLPLRDRFSRTRSGRAPPVFQPSTTA